MRCPVCIEQGKTSTVRSRGVLSNRRGDLMARDGAYFDEEGRRHDHTGRSIFGNYVCSNGHSFETTTYESCWCGWNKERVPRARTQDHTPYDHAKGGSQTVVSDRQIEDKQVLLAMVGREEKPVDDEKDSLVKLINYLEGFRPSARVHLVVGKVLGVELTTKDHLSVDVALLLSAVRAAKEARDGEADNP